MNGLNDFQIKWLRAVHNLGEAGLFYSCFAMMEKFHFSEFLDFQASVSDLAAASDVTRRAMSRYLTQLERAGLIEIDQRYGGKGHLGNYRLALPG